MSNFARPASWLRQLFTQSRTGFVNPSVLSQDVSLTAPFDGGGFPLYDPAMWGKTATSSAAAANTTTIYTVPETAISRILAISARKSLGNTPTGIYVQATLPNGVIVAICLNNTAMVTDPLLNAFQVLCPILPPGAILQGRYQGGSAATVIEWHAIIATAPLGSVFYV